ncbi:MAG: amidohydrolase family protein [Candidatus Hydrogenedentes bacterium]|nr:amidohydrolase family protein [Candidatus Hydrogenedentota bacterium]
MPLTEDLHALIQHTPFVDTHEHLLEESARIALLERDSAPAYGSPGAFPAWPAPDFGWLFSQYAATDLLIAGMPRADLLKVHGWELSPKEKYRLLAPWYARARHTGVMQAAQTSLQLLFGAEDLREDNAERIADQFRTRIHPGYYRVLLNDIANLEYTQVNCLHSPVFRETEQPELLAQDISFVKLATELDVPAVSKLANRDVGSLKDWHEVIDWCFAEFGPRAIAVKNQSAYVRALDYARVTAEEAAPLFARYLRKPEVLSPAEHKAIQDHLFHYCIEKATEYGLPVKLHTGYYADENKMPLHRLRRNAGDVAELLLAHPKTTFVIMHIDWPYDAETTALAKHFNNAYVDMCWIWVVNPLAGVRWLKEFLVTAPSNKVLTFGGDYLAVESVPGHAALARKGIAQVFGELLRDGWLHEHEVESLAARIMHGNAHELFDERRVARG